MLADDPYLGAIPRDSIRAHLGPMPTEPILLPAAVLEDLARRREAERALAQEWLAQRLLEEVQQQAGHGPRHQGTFMPVTGVPPWTEEVDDALEFPVRMGEHTFVVTVRR